MRAAIGAVLMGLIATPALAGAPNGHMQLPPSAPAFALSNGDRFGRLQDSYGPPARETGLSAVATSLGVTHANGRTDVFNYSLSRDDDGNAEPDGAVAAGTFANGAAQFQLRWKTD
jgi:hypothetical protein